MKGEDKIIVAGMNEAVMEDYLSPEKFAEIYDKYVGAIYRFIYFKVKEPQTAEDLTGETFLKTWQYLQNGTKINNIRAFFYRTASNLVTDHYRKQSNAAIPIEIDKEADIEDDRASREIEKVNLGTDMSVIQQTLQQINSAYREILVMYFIDQLSITEIAEIKDKKEGAIRVLIHRALKSFKNKLPKSFVEALQKMPTKKEGAEPGSNTNEQTENSNVQIANVEVPIK